MSTDDERRRIAEMNARVRSTIERHGVRTERDRWVLEEVSGKETPILAVPRLSVPTHFTKTCSRAELARVQRILAELQEWSQALVGLTDHEATVLYNGDPAAVVLRDDLAAWGLAYARARLARPNPRDQGSAFHRWMRVSGEVCGWLDELGTATGTRVAISDVADRVAREIWCATVGPDVWVQREAGGLWIDPGPVSPEVGVAIRETLMLYAWHEIDALELARERFTRRAEGNDEDLRARRSRMAADLVELRSHIIGTHDALAVAADVHGGSTTFEWGYQHSAGMLVVAPDRARLARQLEEGLFHGLLRIHLDGQVSGHVDWWVPSGDPGWEVALIEPLHAALVERWLAQAPAGAPVEEPTRVAEAVAVVADGCLRIAEPVEGRRVPAVRMETLLLTLERRFGCEVAQGKGSEVTVYRPGGRKYTLGRHTRNTHVPAHVIRGLLKAVGITVREWWRVLEG